jgi:hypothetical protein
MAMVSALVIAPAFKVEGSSGTIGSGSDVCDGPVYSSTSVHLTGSVTSGYETPKWSIWWSADNTTYSKKFVVTANSVDHTLSQSTNPELFPGYFLGCINNNTGVTISYTMSFN